MAPAVGKTATRRPTSASTAGASTESRETARWRSLKTIPQRHSQRQARARRKWLQIGMFHRGESPSGKVQPPPSRCASVSTALAVAMPLFLTASFSPLWPSPTT